MSTMKCWIYFHEIIFTLFGFIVVNVHCFKCASGKDANAVAMDACEFTKANGRRMMIDFQTAAFSLSPSCTCRIQAVEEGFVSFQLLHVPEEDQCGATIYLSANTRRAPTRYTCKKQQTTRLLSVDKSMSVTLKINKTSTPSRDANTQFCFQVTGFVDIYIKCTPDPIPDDFTDYTSTTVGTPPSTDTYSSKIKLSEAIPATVGGAVFVIATILAVLCLLRRYRQKNDHLRRKSKQHILESDSQSNTAERRHCNVVKTYSENSYETIKDPNRAQQITQDINTISANSTARYEISEIVPCNSNGYITPASQQVPPPETFNDVTSDYETSTHFDDNENPYDTIQEVTYANSPRDGRAFGNPDYYNDDITHTYTYLKP